MPPPLREDEWILAALERYERGLVAYAARLLGDVERARDVVQETFLKLCSQERSSVEDRLREWLFAVCRNRALDVREKESPMQVVEPERTNGRPTAEQDPAREVERKETASRVLDLVDSLPPNQREVLLLKFQHGLAYKEIGSVTELSVSNVGFLIHRGLKTLRQRFANERLLERTEGRV